MRRGKSTVRITRAREFFTRGNRELRRARRLYAQLIRRRVIVGRFVQWRLLNECVMRARYRGLYAVCASQWDAMFSIMRYLWRIHRREQGPRSLDWYGWCERHNFGSSRLRTFGGHVLPRRKAGL